MIWEFGGYGGQIAIRDGKWKAVRQKVKSRPEDWELYNLETDREESRNLATQNPEIIQRLEAEYMRTRTVEPDFLLPFYDKMND
jgi:arylsulfatase A-like enzyme